MDKLKEANLLTKEEQANRDKLEPKYNIPKFLGGLAVIVFSIILGDILIKVFGW